MAIRVTLVIQVVLQNFQMGCILNLLKLSLFKLILRYTTLHIIYNSVHEDSSDDHWWRGCKPDHGEPLGCTQHNFEHHDHDELVDECVCKEELCNREMGPIETSTSVSTTTIKGNLLL